MSATAPDLARLLAQAKPREIDLKCARACWREFRVGAGFKPEAALLTAPDGSMKAEHTLAAGSHVYMLYLASGDVSGYEVCRYRTPECSRGCLFTAGRASYTPYINRARALKTRFLAEHPDAFFTILAHEIRLASKRHKGERVGVRLNGTSDLPFETIAPWLMDLPVQFYDYTAWPIAKRPGHVALHLTSSVKETARSEPPRELNGRNYAVVFDVAPGAAFPETYAGRRVIDGNVTDARYLDPADVVVGLSPRGELKTHEVGGMVKRNVAESVG